MKSAVGQNVATRVAPSVRNSVLQFSINPGHCASPPPSIVSQPWVSSVVNSEWVSYLWYDDLSFAVLISLAVACMGIKYQIACSSMTHNKQLHKNLNVNRYLRLNDVQQWAKIQKISGETFWCYSIYTEVKSDALLLFSSRQSRALSLPPASWHLTDKDRLV